MKTTRTAAQTATAADKFFAIGQDAKGEAIVISWINAGSTWRARSCRFTAIERAAGIVTGSIRRDRNNSAITSGRIALSRRFRLLGAVKF